jgi:hypothetical protein
MEQSGCFRLKLFTINIFSHLFKMFFRSKNAVPETESDEFVQDTCSGMAKK